MKITYIHHSSFLVELKAVYLLFDYTEGELPKLDENKPLLIFASHRHWDHFSPVIFKLRKTHRINRFILSDDINESNIPQEALSITDFIGSGEVMGYADDKACMGSGGAGEPEDFNSSMGKKYSAQIDLMTGMHVDVAFLPLDPRQEEYFYLGLHEFMNKVDVDHVFPMHFWGDFSIIDQLKKMDCSAEYRDRIVSITSDGEEFVLE